MSRPPVQPAEQLHKLKPLAHQWLHVEPHMRAVMHVSKTKLNKDFSIEAKHTLQKHQTFPSIFYVLFLVQISKYT